VLGAERGRKRFLARLGHEADDALDEFLNLALEYERRETPSLQGFMAWLRGTQTDVKRDMEIRRDEVRVMTVHGAKGLEAPIVVLADTTTVPSSPGQRQPRLIPLPHADAPTPFAWAGIRASDSAVVGAARERLRREAEDEYRRLLYVAMTRAIDRLIVCGADGERPHPEGCWWNLVHAALQGPCVVEPHEDGDGQVWRYRKVPVPAGAALSHAGEEAAAAHIPPWLERPAPAEAPAPVPLSPSSAYDETVLMRASTGASRAEREKAMARGVLMHRLLQSLPDIAHDRRAPSARRHLARNAAGFSSAECEAMVDAACRLLEDPRFAALFLPGSRAEVPIVGRLPAANGTIAVSGQVDRLVVSDSAVLLADYKTNRPAPRRVENVPPAYLEQLALYRAVLGQLYPEKTIRAALVWTDVPDLMEVPPALLDGALARVTST
jgi:ATP-dependent helicase/nuclease subunit A